MVCLVHLLGLFKIICSYTVWNIYWTVWKTELLHWMRNWMNRILDALLFICVSKNSQSITDNNLLSSGQFFICILKKVKWIDFYTQCLIDSFSLVGFKMRHAVSKERFALLFAWLKWLRPLKESRSLHQSHSWNQINGPLMLCIFSVLKKKGWNRIPFYGLNK